MTTRTTLAAPDGRVASEVENVVVVSDGKGGARPLTEDERAALTG